MSEVDEEEIKTNWKIAFINNRLNKSTVAINEDEQSKDDVPS